MNTDRTPSTAEIDAYLDSISVMTAGRLREKWPASVRVIEAEARAEPRADGLDVDDLPNGVPCRCVLFAGRCGCPCHNEDAPSGDLSVVSEARGPMEAEIERLREAARCIAALTEDDIRDYEQGLCFFCGAGHVVVPGQRGGVTGVRSKTPVHEADCSYIALRAALASEDRPMTIGTASTQTFCSRCNHPMHWKVCGVERDGLPSSCRCRNDAALEEPTP